MIDGKNMSQQNNYQNSLVFDFILLGPKINNSPAIETAKGNFKLKENMFHNPEKRFVKLLLLETSMVVSKTEMENQNRTS